MRKFNISAIKGIGVVACLTACLLSSTGCGKSNINTKEVESAIDKLSEYGESYVVTNSIELPNGAIYYIECNTPDGSYTEYPLDENNNLGNIDYTNASDTSYVLYDWLTSEGDLYVANSNYSGGDSSVWLTMPDSYGDKIKSREVLYLDKMKGKLSNTKQVGTEMMDLGSGEVEVTLYEGEIPSSVVKEIMGMDSIALFQSVKTDYKDNKNISSLMDNYIDELDLSLTFSKGIVTFGIYDGVVRYVQINSGGLGTRMFYTKVVLDQDVEYRTLPDFSSTELYVDSLKELADYVATFDSYAEALKSLEGTNGTIPDEIHTNSDAVEE